MKIDRQENEDISSSRLTISNNQSEKNFNEFESKLIKKFQKEETQILPPI